MTHKAFLQEYTDRQMFASRKKYKYYTTTVTGADDIVTLMYIHLLSRV